MPSCSIAVLLGYNCGQPVTHYYRYTDFYGSLQNDHLHLKCHSQISCFKPLTCLYLHPLMTTMLQGSHIAVSLYMTSIPISFHPQRMSIILQGAGEGLRRNRGKYWSRQTHTQNWFNWFINRYLMKHIITFMVIYHHQRSNPDLRVTLLLMLFLIRHVFMVHPFFLYRYLYISFLMCFLQHTLHIIMRNILLTLLPS